MLSVSAPRCGHMFRIDTHRTLGERLFFSTPPEDYVNVNTGSSILPRAPRLTVST